MNIFAGLGTRDSGLGRALLAGPVARGSERDARTGDVLRPASFCRVPSPESRVPQAQRGFSLIEIIAALLILAIAFAALMQVAGGSIGLTNNAADHAQAALWARSLLDSAGMEKKLQPGTTEGKFDDQYRWRLAVAPYQPGDAGNNTPMQIFKLDLDVMWGGRRERTAHFSTLRLVSAVPQAQGQLR